jgi:hypothetical protein
MAERRFLTVSGVEKAIDETLVDKLGLQPPRPATASR